jgi:serine/threonine protein kinase
MKQEKENLKMPTLGPYQIQDKINQGAFGVLYRGEHRKTREPVAIKMENSAYTSLRHETRMLQYLYEKGVRQIPPIYWYGHKDVFDSQVLIMPFYSCNLENHLQQYAQHSSNMYTQLKSYMRTCVQILEQIHNKFVIHRDIKPANIMVKSDGTLCLIDFGLATFYVDEESRHVPDNSSVGMVGTVKYASLYIHRGRRYSRRDDLISLVYMYDSLLRGYVPWHPDNFVHPNQQENMEVDRSHIDHPMNQKWLQSKMEYLQDHVCKREKEKTCKQEEEKENLLYKLYQMVYALNYEEKPHYSHLKLLFSETI